MTAVAIRSAGPPDTAGIARLLEACFPEPLEARLVERLRIGDDMVYEAVAGDDTGSLGYVGFCRLVLEGEKDIHAVALAPLAVRADRRRAGIGQALVETGHRVLRENGVDLVTVLGEPDYYTRFGFSAEAAKAFRTPWDGPCMQALPLTDRAGAAAGHLTYPAAFGELG